MINLLPPQYKKELKQEEKWRTILNLEIFLFAFLIALSLILLSVKINVGGLSRSQQILTESERKVIKLETERAQKLGFQNLDERVEAINLNLSKINSFYQKNPNLTQIFQDLGKILPPNSYLTNFSYQKDGFQITLSGFCPDRESLFQLKRNFESQENFKDIHFPSSNWLSPNNFYLSFKINESL